MLFMRKENQAQQTGEATTHHPNRILQLQLQNNLSL